MLHLLWILLKISGIFLLIAFACALLSVLAMLFWPIKYRIKAAREDTINPGGAYAIMKATWLFCLLNIMLGYEKKLFFKVKVCGVTVYDMSKKKKTATKKLSKESAPDAAPPPNPISTPPYAKQLYDLQEEEGKEEKEEKDETAQEKTEPFWKKFSKKIKLFFWKLKALLLKILQFLENIRYTFTALYGKIRKAAKKTAYYGEILGQERSQCALAVIWGETLRLLKHCKPSKLQANIRFGLEDPAAVGQILSVYGILYPLLGQNVHICPDFEHKMLEGNLTAKGRISVFFLLQILWVLYYDKDVRRLYRLLKKGGQVNG